MSKRILVVDDSATIRQSVCMALARTGYHHVTAIDGLDAMQKLTEDHFDMIITDLNMPNLDGFGLIREVRNNSKTRFTPIIILTTEVDAGKKQAGKEAGATGWIVKPFNPDHLLKIVRLALG